ncbi:hypothetical protein GCM10023219_29570 [Stakelama sediminis]|uniref:EAL domain-containing protein (Putative c-di-GMP-specific phosphodiesterase class I)/GGDEF domain-containing protein/DNA-binding NarL/FixJ family response regulator n=1 Tax=Stakelama sediminis TaxID=463200 RepID=A0A840Z3G9_9SPHN|nr:GGDEF domain-containing phosphodiesterase [Stakelama sediminis]MBB5720270.1 EAL domain-containing protein (putative c-di-GMP-specific phosphodiesterase class I)/GGDEF domain-containing protein/DNA-binding NarL/FixJ family response regulator [Stakelama sediminis]
MKAGAGAPILILSFRQRDELATSLADAGWRVIAARRADGIERRWLASGAGVAIVDARGALEEGLAATEALSGPVASRGGALVVLVSQSMLDRLSDFLSAGATHFLASPLGKAELIHGIRFAEAAVRPPEDLVELLPQEAAETLGWRYNAQSGKVQLTPALAVLLEMPEDTMASTLLRQLPAAERRAAFLALRRLSKTTPTTAFAHALPPHGRMVQHLQLGEGRWRLHALVEPLGRISDAGAVVRDALAGVRDAHGARRWLAEHLEDTETDTSAILIGLSRFGVVNTAYGRAAGDALLRQVSRRLEEVAHAALGRDVLVARIGGSDFLIAAAVSPPRIALAADEVQAALARPFAAQEGVMPLGVRIATIAAMPDDDAARFLRRGAEALADARDGRVSSTVQAQDTVPVERLAEDLRKALDRGEIEVRFQPQVAIATNSISGVEALARWRHPQFGELGAETLFAAADRAGLGIALSDRVQQVALAGAAAWPKALSKLRLSINITAEDAARPGFADLLLDRIDSSGFPRSRLTIEITESGLIEDLADAARLLSELRYAGCRVAIDDFGTGYSSLAYLKALPLDYLKIDRQLSQDITGSTRDRVVVRGVIDMARSLGLTVIAEGVETPEQLELLAKEGCQLYQGFLCAEPLETPALAELVARHG